MAPVSKLDVVDDLVDEDLLWQPREEVDGVEGLPTTKSNQKSVMVMAAGSAVPG